MSKYIVNSRRMFKLSKTNCYIEDVTSADGVEFEGHDGEAVFVVRNKRRMGYGIDVFFRAEDVVELVHKIKDGDIEVTVFGASDCNGICNEWMPTAKWEIKEGQSKVKIFTEDDEYIEYIRYIQNNITSIENGKYDYCGVDFIDCETENVTSQLVEKSEDINFENSDIYRYFEVNKNGVIAAVEGFKGYYIDEDDARELDYIAWITFYGKVPDNLTHYIKIKDVLLENESHRDKIYGEDSEDEETEGEDEDNIDES